VWAYGRGQTDTQTQTRVTTIHFASSTTHAKCNDVTSGSKSSQCVSIYSDAEQLLTCKLHGCIVWNATELACPSAHWSPQPKRQISVQPFLRSSQRKVPIGLLYNGRSYPPELSLPMGDLDPHLKRDALIGPCMQAGTVTHNTNDIWIGSAVFAQTNIVSLYLWFACFPVACFPTGDLAPM